LLVPAAVPDGTRKMAYLVELDVNDYGCLVGPVPFPIDVVQIVGMLDVVDMESSIVDRYPSYEILRFPAFRRSESEAIGQRLFRVPQAMVDVFACCAAAYS